MVQTVQLSTATSGCFWFTLWTLFSFFAHYFARSTISASGGETRAQQWGTVTLLTIVQLVIGATALKLCRSLADMSRLSNWINSTEESGKTKSDLAVEERSEPCRMSMYIAHATATLATNASIAFVNTGSAFTVKAFEPITTAILTSMLIGSKLQTHVIISIPLVVTGALGFIWQPSMQPSASFGLGMAFISNLLFGVRNINLKLLQQETTASLKLKLELLEKASIFAAMILTGPMIVLFFVTSFPANFSILNSLISGMFHVTYTIISTCVILKYTSAIGHATGNLLKRILVAAIFFVLGQTVVTTSNWLMGAVMLIGLAMYAFPKACPFNEKKASLSLIAVVVSVVLITSVLSSITPSEVGDKYPIHSDLHLSPLKLLAKVEDREKSLVESVGFNKNVAASMKKSYEDPKSANILSIKAKDTTTLIKEAYRLHQEVFTHIIGRYKKAVLVNVFQWFNKGDHLITIGQRRILERMGIELIYHCFYPGRNCDFSNINKADPELVVLIQGAGYIGHPSHEFVVLTTVDNFPDNRIMVFPISVCHPIEPCTEIQQFATIFSKHKDVHVVLRDRYSYDLAEQYFSTTRNYLAPDSAFAVGSIRMNIVPVYDIIWLKRDDWESQKDAMPEFPKHITVQVQDWDDAWMNQKSDNFWEDHQLRTMTGISYLARAKVVVSDRLHAHIMSQLMGKLNVVINSETKKQEHYYMTWEQSVNTSALVTNNAEALTEALKLLKLYDKSVTLV